MAEHGPGLSGFPGLRAQEDLWFRVQGLLGLLFRVFVGLRV